MWTKLGRIGLYQRAKNKWGTALQLVMAMEESSELQKEVCKILRGDYSSPRMDSLASEIADVEIMTEQLKNMFSIESKVDVEKEVKLDRLERLLNVD
jgi:NTP pyrophosphatase (non-canonical NTP hydrolase)